jgi:hypothetical protein
MISLNLEHLEKKYTKKEIIERLPKFDFIEIQSFDFEPRFISEEVVQVLYRTIIMVDEKELIALRSSIWKIEHNQWKMLFHQSTQIK